VTLAGRNTARAPNSSHFRSLEAPEHTASRSEANTSLATQTGFALRTSLEPAMVPARFHRTGGPSSKGRVADGSGVNARSWRFNETQSCAVTALPDCQGADRSSAELGPLGAGTMPDQFARGAASGCRLPCHSPLCHPHAAGRFSSHASPQFVRTSRLAVTARGTRTRTHVRSSALVRALECARMRT
jgi:hypothetical protein